MGEYREAWDVALRKNLLDGHDSLLTLPLLVDVWWTGFNVTMLASDMGFLDPSRMLAVPVPTQAASATGFANSMLFPVGSQRFFQRPCSQSERLFHAAIFVDPSFTLWIGLVSPDGAQQNVFGCVFQVDEFDDLRSVAADFEELCSQGIGRQGGEAIPRQTMPQQRLQVCGLNLRSQLVLAARDGKNDLASPTDGPRQSSVGRGIAGVQRNC